eukprot:5454625-Karenia_brevis.AAC.1
MFHFTDITEASFESIARRLAVIRIMSRFFEKLYLEEHVPDHEDYGVFAREHDAKEFLTSTVGVAA